MTPTLRESAATVVTAAVLCLASSALAGGRQAASGSQGAPEAAPRRPSPAGAVTLQKAGEPVVDLLRDYSALLGHPRTADRKLEERRVNVFLTGVPDARVRSALADVVSGSWKRGAAEDALRMDANAAADREAARLQEQRRRRFYGAMQSLIDHAHDGDDALRRLTSTDPQSASVLGEPGTRAAAQLAALLRPGEWQQLAGGGQVSLSPDRLGSDAQPLVRVVAEYLNRIPNPPGVPISQRDAGGIDPDQASRQQVDVQIVSDRVGEPYGALSVGIRGRYGSGAVMLGGSSSDGMDTRWTDGRTPTSMPASYSGAQRTLRWDRPPDSWGEALGVVADQLHLNIISEEFTRMMPIPTFVLRGEMVMTIEELLDHLCNYFGYQWRLRDGIYEFRSVAWYFDREHEPPGTLVKAAVVARQEKKRLGLDWLAAAAMLPADQQQRLWRHAREAAPVVADSGALLRLYGALTPEQRSLLDAEAGLRATELSAPSRDAFTTAITALAPAWPADTAATATARLERKPDRAHFSFSAEDTTAEATISYPQLAPLPVGPPRALSAPPR